jgi:two-component system, chemotaxis family, chemotaxis protein CheY
VKALIVDDSRAMRMIIGRTLKGLGFETAEADNGRTALTVLADKGAFDVAFLDWNMPEMDGFDLLQAIRANKALDGMRVMMVTTETEVTQMTRALEAGANEYLMKPFTPEAVAEKLQILGLARAA